MRRLLLSGLAAGCLSTGLAHGAEITERTTYFMVQGATFDELDRALGAAGPLLSTGVRHRGSTDVTFSRDLQFKPGKTACRLTRTNLQLHLVTNLPRWNKPGQVDKTTRTKWTILQKEIADHEARHSKIAKKWLNRMNRELLSLPAEATCVQMELVATRRARELVVEHDKDQVTFDRNEARVIDSRFSEKVAAATGKTVR